MNLQKKYQELFANSQHEKAIELLKSSKGKFEPALYHYNLGVNYAKTNELPLARFHFEKSKDSGFYSLEVSKNLEQVKELLQVESVEANTSVRDHVYDFVLSSSIYSGANLSLALLLLLLFQMKKISRGWVRIILALAMIFPFAFQWSLKERYDQTIALTQKEVWRGPSKIFEQTQEIPAGMKFIVSENFNGWRYVVSPSSHQGWIQNKSLRKL